MYHLVKPWYACSSFYQSLNIFHFSPLHKVYAVTSTPYIVLHYTNTTPFLDYIGDIFLAALVIDELSESVQPIDEQVNERGDQQQQTKQPENAESRLSSPIHGGIHGFTGSHAVNHIENNIHEHEGYRLIDVENSGFLGADEYVGDDVDRTEDLNEYTGGVRTFREKKQTQQDLKWDINPTT